MINTHQISDLTNHHFMDDDYSNFRLFGIGKPTANQLKREAERKAKRAEAKEERGGLTEFGKIENVAMKYNPAAAIPRSGFLVALRLNAFGLSRCLYPALLSESELKARHFDIENAKKAKAALDKAKKFWLKIGGRSVSLENEIRKGYDKPVFNTKKMQQMKAQEKFTGFDSSFLDLMTGEYSNVTGVDDAAVAGYISSAIPIIGEVANLIIKSGAAKNPYVQGSQEADKINKEGDAGTPPPVDPAALKKIEDAGANDIFGMPKIFFWGGVGVITILASVGGYYAYKNYKNKPAI